MRNTIETRSVKANGSTPMAAEVCIVGLGYVGLTLAVALADSGMRVVGCDASPAVVEGVAKAEPPFWEKGLPERLREFRPEQFAATGTLPDPLPETVVICVGTPLDESHSANLGALEAVVEVLAARVTPDTLVILRSTVPIGTSRNLVLPALQRRVEEPLLAFAPERTIQGQALEELRNLPQVVGGLTETATDKATALFKRLAPQVVRVSSLEAAEMIKLINNSHTDLIYGFGNEVALIAEAIGLDASELIRGANLDYPRPDLSRPGFVGGSCLTKDPYILISSAEAHGYSAPMVTAARQVNENLPDHVADRVLAALRERGDPAQAKVLVSGVAYKGYPETDDVRGGAAERIGARIGPEVGAVVAHDFVVGPERIASLGLEPIASVEEGFQDADAALILNDHARYGSLDLPRLVGMMRTPIVFDAWGVFEDQLRGHNGVTYLRLGIG
jgi:UDP-N-acetyl-D-mannosaminuronic acid dehydrogenase